MGKVTRASRRLAKEGFVFMVCDNECQITMFKNADIIDFWPNTDLWWIRGTSNKRRGIEKLIDFLKKDTK